ncbi:MAG TPA: ABC transporter ATP-binding protein [Burkholderiaceae bacterium]|nr:ABC transporter ATP-binding protein [Burkholderiaceae bacterium]
MTPAAAGPILSVSGVGKAYRRYRSESRRLLALMGAGFKPTEETWVLRDVSFDVHPGEALGIVGQNGAGKSTLLKLVTGTLRPTEGRVAAAGRIAAILELGMGFHPDFTGRRNVMHAGSLMGLDRAFLEDAMPGIEDFAEIGEYFDQPVRTYSSGMQVRVAFALATAMRPQLLIIDEALSVGDTYFQHKSFERIREFRRAGTTLLIVSHDKTAVQTLCDRAILLDKGRMLRDADPAQVMDFYNAMLADRENQRIEVINRGDAGTQTISGTGQAKVEDISLHGPDGERVEMIPVGQTVELRITVRAFADIPTLVLGYQIKDRLGQSVFGTNTFHTRQPVENVRSGELISFRIRFKADLGTGSYSVSTALVSTDTHLVDNFEWRDLAALFTMVNLEQPYFEGIAWLPPTFDIERQ